MKKSSVVFIIYLVLLCLPIYWMVITSFKNDHEILNETTLIPKTFNLDNYKEILAGEQWRKSFKNSIFYVILNVIVTVSVSIPAAYAFSRWNFRGSKHLFFWLLTNRMAPAAVFMLPFTELYMAMKIFDTHYAVALAHTLFNIPLAIWILEGFMSAIPKELDETAFTDGLSFPSFFVKIFFPLIAPGVGVAAFFAFTFSWIETMFAGNLTASNAIPIGTVLTNTMGASGVQWGIISAVGVLTVIPGAIVVYFVRNYIAKGFAMGRV